MSAVLLASPPSTTTTPILISKYQKEQYKFKMVRSSSTSPKSIRDCSHERCSSRHFAGLRYLQTDGRQKDGAFVVHLFQKMYDSALCPPSFSPLRTLLGISKTIMCAPRGAFVGRLFWNLVESNAMTGFLPASSTATRSAQNCNKAHPCFGRRAPLLKARHVPWCMAGILAASSIIT